MTTIKQNLQTQLNWYKKSILGRSPLEQSREILAKLTENDSEARRQYEKLYKKSTNQPVETTTTAVVEEIIIDPETDSIQKVNSCE
jgi:hypothetical protein